MFLCYCLPEKDSKSRTKTNSSPALIRAYGRTDGRTDVTSKFSRLDGLPISIAMVLRPRAPSAPAGAPLIKSFQGFIWITCLSLSAPCANRPNNTSQFGLPRASPFVHVISLYQDFYSSYVSTSCIVFLTLYYLLCMPSNHFCGLHFLETKLPALVT